ncbi:MAG: peptidoglycan DD-metalloendopeptidase family protein [Oscillospiraceae bacterium]
MRKDRNKKSLNTKAFTVATVLGVAAIAAASFAAVNRTMDSLTPTTSDTSSGTTWVFGAPESSPANVEQSGVARDDHTESSDESINDPVSAQEAASEAETIEAEEVNKPVKSEARNIMPVQGEVSHPFSNGELVKSETLGVWKTHDGCDILCPLGSDVKSMSSGTVSEIREDPLWGVCVVVEQDNGLTVEYCGLAKELSVKTGQEIKEGEIIGKTSDTCQIEIVQEPHLHIGVKQGGKWIDPMSVITGGFEGAPQ